ncbi:unknown [Prevotella sp. CAG:255]|nr:unknown [Prevotella sp. CAG:255]
MSSKFPLIFVQKTDEKNYYHIYNFSNNNRFLYYSRVFISYF